MKYAIYIIALLFPTLISSTSLAQSTLLPKEKDFVKGTELISYSFNTVKVMAESLIRSGFSAGTTGYKEVWIRDFNTFINLSCKVLPRDSIKERVIHFFQFQGTDGNIVDGYVPTKEANVGYNYILSEYAPHYAAHKNTVETDQETSLVQAVFKYVDATGDFRFLDSIVDGLSVKSRIEKAFDFLLKERFSQKYGLLYGATTIDWGDVQPETTWGVVLDDSSHLAIDVYDNAMFLIALNDYLKFYPEESRWIEVKNQIKTNIRRFLWDPVNYKFIPHIYLNDSPFPTNFDENEIYYHGGTIVAMEAGLLDSVEVIKAYKKMQSNLKLSGAASVGLTVYPPYPDGFFKNPALASYSYQNGGDWTWFGGRIVPQLIKFGYKEEAFEAIRPMIDRVIKNKDFFEWYTIDNQPRGAGGFRGSAGVLYDAIEALEEVL